MSKKSSNSDNQARGWRSKVNRIACDWRIKVSRISGRYPRIALMLVLISGIMIWGGFNTALEATNNETFCISCHEMNNNVYQEYKQTIHYKNTTGVRATCPDCHVPKEWEHMVVRKIGATNELYHKIMGTIDTPEKFKARRLKLAKVVWKKMKNTDSRECRNCHGFSYMDLPGQSSLAREKHTLSLKNGLTCIDCHMGIAHKLPEDFDKDGKEHERFRREKVSCSNCHSGMARAPD